MKRDKKLRLHAMTGLSLLATMTAAAAQHAFEPQRLPIVVVSATRHALDIADAPAAMSVITRAQIEQRGADEVLEAIRGETGVAVFGRTIAGRKGVSLRGMDSRHTLFLVDGMRIGASDGVIGHSDFQLDWVPVEEIERIEIVRGPLSALYGAEALGGVLQIITRAPADRLEGSALAEASRADGDRGGDGHRISARLSGPLGETLRAAVSVASTQRDAVASSLDPRVSALESRDKTQAALRLQWRPMQGQEFNLDLRGSDETRDATSVERGGLRRVYLSSSDIERRHAGIGWQADWGGPQQLGSVVRAYASRIAMTNQRNNGVAALRPNRIDDRVIDAQLSGRASKAHLLTGGIELRDEQLTNLSLPGGESTAQHRAVFLQDEIVLGPGLTVTAGVRRDAHEGFGSQWSPRLYAVWRVAPNWIVKGGASRGFKPPTLKQITPGYQEDEGPNTFTSDPNLKPETNHAWEIGAAWNGPAAGVQLMLFDNRVDNLIVPRLLGIVAGRGSYIFANLDDARLRGVEMAASFRLPAGFAIAASYQYLDARDGLGQRIERRPRHSGSVGLDWARGPWRADLRVESSADMLLPSGRANLPVPDSTRVAAGLAVSVTPELEFSIGISNLTNLNLADKSPLYTWAEAPRTVRIGLRGRW